MSSTELEEKRSSISSKSSKSSKSSIDSHKKIPYPKSVFFIVSNEFCERFSYYGMRTVLPLYLTDRLLFSEEDATLIFHMFSTLVYVFPVFGAMIADSWLGKFKTIVYVSIIYALGNITLSLAATPPIGLPEMGFSMTGLLLIALGTGGIKPCVAAFGGDQFILPFQEHQLTQFFSIFYFSINFGSFISSFITPLIRDKPCFDSENCFTLAFGIPGILMIVSIIIFVAGKPLYRMKPPEGNMLLKVSKAIGNAISTKSKNKGEKKPHWLDYAEEKYGNKLVVEIRSLLSVLFLFIPLPVFWALFDQQSTTWTFLARRMDGDIGFYYILPDQMTVINPILILAFIPLYEYVFYPVLDKLHLLQTPLKRLAAGGVLAGIAFLISGCVALAVEAQEPVIPEAGIGHLNFYNNLNCPVTINAVDLSTTPTTISEHTFKQFVLEFKGSKDIEYTISGDCVNVPKGAFNLEEEKEIGYYFLTDRKTEKFTDSLEKNDVGEPNLRFLLKYDGVEANVPEITVTNEDKEKMFSIKATNTSIQSVSKPGIYKISIGSDFTQEIEVRMGGVYAILGEVGADELYLEITTEPNSIHMLLLTPQYIVMTLGEVMYSVTGLEFAYSQAPKSMKSVVQAGWLLTTAFGNLLVVLIEAIGTFEKTSNNLFLFAIIMFIDMLIFGLMARSYTYVDPEIDELDGVDNEGFEEKKEP